MINIGTISLVPGPSFSFVVRPPSRCKMVNVMKGVLVKCDPAMKQFLLHLDEKLKLGSKFVLQVSHAGRDGTFLRYL